MDFQNTGLPPKPTVNDESGEEFSCGKNNPIAAIRQSDANTLKFRKLITERKPLHGSI